MTISGGALAMAFLILLRLAVGFAPLARRIGSSCPIPSWAAAWQSG